MSSENGIPEPATLRCPACNGEVVPDAVFCGNPGCGKALGEFRYVREEFAAATTPIQRFADRVNEWSGQPRFVTLHALWFVGWIVLNSGLATVFGMFDSYPYGLLGIILSIEAILLTGLLLISNNRQNEHARKRAELDYEVTVRTYRKLCELERDVVALRRDIDARLGPSAG
jgi:uncharacterized membrane protein